MMRIEAIFGGILAIFVLGVAVYALATTQFGGGGPRNTGFGEISSVSTIRTAETESEGVCSCYNEAFKLAGSDVSVTSAQYRTGFEQCRTLLGVEGGDAWTAGWNARLSAKPYESSCRAYRKRRT
ncbi:MAG: hypothetical protein AAGJ87_13125 [Pseudomonadota bacterium]